jgi:hypothetical protein
MVTMNRRLIVIGALGAALVFGSGAISPVAGLAQDATPEAGAAAGIPNHIFSGTCGEEGDIVAPLSNLVFEEAGTTAMDMGATPTGMDATPTDMGATPMAGMQAMGVAVPVAVSVTNVELSLDDILAGPHAFNAHDPNDPSMSIACGDISGTPDEQGNLFVGIAEQNGSGLSGAVWLVDDGTGAGTVVTVFLVGGYESTAAPATGEDATPVG